jgi:CheY-like chemotaxis protein
MLHGVKTYRYRSRSAGVSTYPGAGACAAVSELDPGRAMTRCRASETMAELMSSLKAGRAPVGGAAARRLLVKKSVLIAEASDGGYFMLQRAFAQAKLPHMLRRVRDGAQALAYVMGRDGFADRQHFPYPDLIIAQTVMPKIGGIEVLRYLRRELKLDVPAIIFAGSLAAIEMRAVTELGRADYYVMPFTFSVLVDMLQSVQQTWLSY